MRLLFVISSLVSQVSSDDTKWNGLCYASWATNGADSYDSEQSDASIKNAAQTGINTLAITNTYYSLNQDSTSIAFDDAKSNRDDSVRRAVSEARAAGLRVALKPHVDFSDDEDHWRGQIGPNFSESEWTAWFASYKAFVLGQAHLGRELNVDLFIVGTELATTESHESEWRDVIQAIRGVVGEIPLTYACNWGPGETPGPAAVNWWDALDFIGVDAYYPLATTPGKTVDELTAAWSNSPSNGDIVGDLEKLSTQFGKSVMFTEIGYTSTDACAVGNHAGGNLDMQAQADVYTSFFEAVYPKDWFAGVFIWDWETNPHQGGRCDGGAFSFTPAGKTAQEVMQKYFGPPPAPGPPTPTPAPPACSDSSPDSAYSCAQQAGWGKCGESWMIGSCCKTCFNCQNCNGLKVAGSKTIYQNGNLAWSDYTYNCPSKTTKGTGQVYPGHQYSAHGKCKDWGALSFRGGSFWSGDYQTLSFSIHSSSLSTDQVQVSLYGASDASHPFSPLFASFYVDSCHLDQNGWVDVTIPMADLLPPSGDTNINRVEFKTNYATGVGEIWLDNIAFLSSSDLAIV